MGVRLDQYTAATNPTFKGIIQASVTQAAIDVLNDPERSEQHKALARTLLMGPAAGSDMYLNQFVWQAALNPAIIAASKTGYDKIVDNDVDFVIASAWDLVAG